MELETKCNDWKQPILH